MKIGMMNNPRKDPVKEVEFARESGFDFIDLTLEHPFAHLSVVDRKELLKAIRESGLGVVGHTTYYLPFASPIGSIREAAVRDVIESLGFFKEAGAEIVTVHPDPGVGTIEPKTTVSLNALSFAMISDEARKMNLQIVVENVPGYFSTVEALKPIFKAVSSLGFHLDVGHAFIGRNRYKQLLNAFGEKLLHVHLSDNRMREDDHMPLGAGNINWEEVLRTLKKTGYDSTITLEVFSEDRRYLIASRDKLISLWRIS